MKRLLLILVVGLVFIAGSLFSMRPTPLISEALEEKRFKIYFSPHRRSDTFLLDGEVGTVYMLMENYKDEVIWSKMALSNPSEKTFTERLIEGTLPEEEED